MALSYINRKRKDLELPSVSRTSQENVGHLAKEASDTKTSPQDLQARILVMTASGSTATQYMNYMNAFFTAQVKSLALMRYFTR